MAIQIKKTGKKLPARQVYYGEPGIGKTTQGAAAPNPVFLATEDGISGIPGITYVDLFSEDHTWSDVLEAVDQLQGEEYKTVVIDTLDGVFHLCCEHICKTEYDGIWDVSQGKDGFMSFYKGYKRAAVVFRELLAGLDKLRTSDGMQTIMLSHAEIHNQKNPLGADFGKLAPAIHKDTWNLVCGWSDVVGYAGRDMVVVNADKDGKGGQQKLKSKDRWVVFDGDGGIDAKSRAGYELPPKMPFKYKLIEAELYKESTRKEARDAVAV